MKQLCFTAILFSLLVSSCQEDTVVEKKDYPYVITKEIEVSESGAILFGELNKFGNEILMYGFVWSENPLPTINDNIIEFYDSPDKEFSYNIHAALAEGKNYYVRTYAQSAEYLVYGNQMTFNSLGSLPPAITSFTPEFGPIGTVVEITGENFSNNLNGNIVRFGDETTIVDSVKENKIYVKVPYFTESQNANISIETAKMKAVSIKEFNIWNPWKKMNNFDKNMLFETCSFSIGNKGYIGLGFSGTYQSYSKELWEFDPKQDTWTRKADFPGKVEPNPVAFSINNKGYVYLGNANESDNDEEKYSAFWEYSQENDKWTKKADCPGPTRDLAVGFSINNKGYIGPGKYREQGGNLKYVTDFWEYDPYSDSWTRKADFPGERRIKSIGFSIGDYGYVGMGYSNVSTNDLYKYNQKNDTWEFVSEYPGMGKNFLNGKSINGFGYIGLGLYGGNVYNTDFWKYSPEDNTWVKLTPFPFPAYFEADFVINGKMYLILATYEYKITYREFVYEFDPSKN